MKKGTVLFVDDQPDVVKYYVRALKDSGYGVEVLTSAAQAWEYFLNFRPDVCAVILDIIMPPAPQIEGQEHHKGTWTGVFLYRRILELLDMQKSQVQPIPIAVLTQSTDKEMMDRLEEIHSRFRPTSRVQFWGKGGLDPFEFEEQFTEWLRATEESHATQHGGQASRA